MATSTITNTAKDANGNAIDYVARFRLTTAAGQESGFRLSDGTAIPAIYTTSSAGGAISVALENNANITPGGSFYIAELMYPSSNGGTQEAAIISSSSVSPQNLYSALVSAIPSYVPPTSVPPTILGGNNIFTGTNQFNGSIILGSDPEAQTINDVPGLNARRVSIQPLNVASSTGSVELQLVPGTNSDPTTTVCDVLLFRVPGTNYERFGISNNAGVWVIDSSKANAGVARNIQIQNGGDAILGTTASINAIFYRDGSVDLAGATYTQSDGTRVATRTRIADPTNAGDSRLIIDTRTGTPSSVFTDDSLVEYRRGGTAKWQVGLNAGGANNDTYDIRSASGNLYFSARDNVVPQIGVFGISPSSRPTVSGSWGSTTGKSVATALASLGLFVDNTTT